jgi:hypothetical protein
MGHPFEDSFDCVEMKRRGAERVLAATAGLTPEEELEYGQKATADLKVGQEDQRPRRVRLASEPRSATIPAP